jgi:SpoVK/Ycf46/Vps4 family AAA+-type ATPase
MRTVKLEADFPFNEIAKQTDGLSGSDLKEICRNAVMTPISEYISSLKGNISSLENKTREEIELRPVVAEDFYKQEGLKNPKRRHETPALVDESLD